MFWQRQLNDSDVRWFEPAVKPLASAAVPCPGYNADADGICDDVDPCVGELDACGICNGSGAIYDCGCSDIPEGDCNGNQLDALGECGGPCEADGRRWHLRHQCVAADASVLQRTRGTTMMAAP